MAEQNNGGLLDEVIHAVEGMAGDKMDELKDDVMHGDIEKLQKDASGILEGVMGGSTAETKKTKSTKKAEPKEETSEGGGLLDEVMNSVKGSAADAVKGEIEKEVKENLGGEVGGLLKGLLGGDK